MSEKIRKFSIDHNSYHARISCHEFERETTSCYFEQGRKLFKITGSREFFDNFSDAKAALKKCIQEHEEETSERLDRIRKEKLIAEEITEGKLISDHFEQMKRIQAIRENGKE